MNVLMLSLMYPEDMKTQVARDARDKLQNQINSYQRAFVEGIKANLLPDERLEIVNALPVGVFPLQYRRLLIPSGWHDGHTVYELGCINSVSYTHLDVYKRQTMAELVCSNSLRSDRLSNAVGLLKAEMRMLDSLIMRAADENAVPAGGALAVDRAGFSAAVDKAVRQHPLITVHEQEAVSYTHLDVYKRQLPCWAPWQLAY